MKSYYILHNPHDKVSKKFVNDYGMDHIIVNWYEDGIAVAAYLAEGNPTPSAFPSVVDPDTKLTARIPMTMELAIKDLENQHTLKTDPTKQYKINRIRKYEEQGLFPHAWVMAWVQFQEDGDESELNRLRAIRTEVKNSIPKAILE